MLLNERQRSQVYLLGAAQAARLRCVQRRGKQSGIANGDDIYAMWWRYWRGVEERMNWALLVGDPLESADERGEGWRRQYRREVARQTLAAKRELKRLLALDEKSWKNRRISSV